MSCIKIKKLNQDAIMPKRATDGSAGMDLSYCGKDTVTIKANERVVLPTGLSIALPSNNYVLLIFPRSGHGVNHGITLSNCVGVIDSDYRGEVCIALSNHSDTDYTVLPFERIAQMVVMPIALLKIEETDDLPPTLRGGGGFGSSGNGIL